MGNVVLTAEEYTELYLKSISSNDKKSNSSVTIDVAFLSASLDPMRNLTSNLSAVVETLKKSAVYSQIFVWEGLYRVPDGECVKIGNTLPSVIGRLDSRALDTNSIEIFTGNRFEQEGYVIEPVVNLGYLVSVLIYKKSDLNSETECIINLVYRLMSMNWCTGILTSVAYKGKSNENQKLVTRFGTDPLTGMLNRQRLEEDAPSFKPLHVAMVDLNKFKSVNDNYGHQAGDLVLKELGAAMLKFSSRDVTPYRYGGDEFVILSNDIETMRTYVYGLADYLKDKLIRLKAMDTVINYYISLSIGVQFDSISLEDGVKRSDALMYSTKKGSTDDMRILESL